MSREVKVFAFGMLSGGTLVMLGMWIGAFLARHGIP